MSILITGGAGFIGSNFVYCMLDSYSDIIINIDKLTYAGNIDTLKKANENKNHIFIKGDICKMPVIEEVFKNYRPEAVIHFAAESHVDRSIEGPKDFITTNIIGTFNLLEVARNYYADLEGKKKDEFRFLHVSTDEVYGSLGEKGYFTEESKYMPNSPYSASKASSDHLVRSYYHTYGLPTIISNCSNNYGPRQFPEKLIPLMILNALDEKRLPVYGKGLNIRDWLYVDDHCAALYLILKRGKVGDVYNIGGKCEKKNIEVVNAICSLLDEIKPLPSGNLYNQLIEYVEDRPGHDYRYAVDINKISNELGWKPQETFASGLRKTIEWYMANLEWCNDIKSGKYQGERLGLI